MRARWLAVLMLPVMVVASMWLVGAAATALPAAMAKLTAATTRPTRPGAVSKPILVLASRGAAVRRVQTLLNRHGYRVPVTGYYGPRTLRQVRRFQAAHGIPTTGRVGRRTWGKLLGRVGRRPATQSAARGRPAPARSAPAPAARAGATGVVYLTFDDGPSPDWTPQVLQLLARYRARATFFVLGRSAAAYPELIRRAYAAGHGIGNHTWNHRRLTGLTGARLAAEVGATSAAIQRITGAPVRCLRPPYASVDAASARRIRALGLRLVLWDIDTNDWRRPGVGAIAGRVLRRVGSGDVVLLHDGGGNRSQTLAALEQVLAGLSARGFRFGALCRG
jgi:peptidoglycan-N-acetylglucosamine deacetylase